ncbi:uncharacterized protein wu:fb97g03 isoform X2 [Pseudorasbora parva]|uniref:uncharacterized protein wu:fb97g03 isoform X2 n=1 Tax=Pseudorasbora parva TaxID=51549 RepID=UPI00351E16C7
MADKQNGDEARLPNCEDAATCDDNENTSQGKLVTPSGVPGLYVPDKAAAPNNLITEVSVPLSGESTPCDGGVEVMPQDSTRATTAPESNGCKAATLKSGEKRERESDSDNASEIPVKRRLTLSEDTEEETVQDYDARCAELWIDAEIAACEAYEFSQVNRPRQVPRDPRRNKSSPAQPVTQRTDDAKTAITACFQEFIKVFRQTEVLRRADFSGMINAVRGMRRDFTALSNEIHNIRAEQRQTLDVLSLMAERMNVIQMYVTDMHKND